MGIATKNTDSVASEAASPAGNAGNEMDITIPSIADTDVSSNSSTSTDLFDGKSSSPSKKIKMTLDTDGDWQRFGSSESAASTGTNTSISSICSSVVVDDTIGENVMVATPPRKRMADGNFKQPTTLSEQSSELLAEPELDQSTNITEQLPKKKLKRRGRPPRIQPETSEVSPKITKVRDATKAQLEVRPRSSIPSRLPANVYASQCIEAAYASRFDPYSLHAGEHRLLVDRLVSKEITVYLNIRNGILRLWKQNPLCSVTLEEAIGCAKENRFFGLAEVAFKWLSRNGYINFGCVEIPKDSSLPKRLSKELKQRTVVVIGAGVSGLTTARQLENQVVQDASKWISMGERPPRIIVLEGRKRIGGRVYSKPLRSQIKDSLPDNLRNTAEMGAMIVTGFEHGNPLDTIIRSQLGLRYHLMKDALTIYDIDGRAIEEGRDMLTTELYTDISDRAGEFRAMSSRQHTLRGDEDLINRCRDPAPEGLVGFHLEPLPTDHIRSYKPAARRGRRRNAPPGTELLTGRSQIIEGGSATSSAVRAARSMGWQIRDGVPKNQSLSLREVAVANTFPTLGTVMNEAIEQYQDLIKLTAQDMRLLNWHHANLEYANAAPVSCLSLSGHDQDTGNEFEGAHSEIIGGYTQVPRGLMNLPTKLDVRFDSIVESIHYDDGDESHGKLPTTVVCTNGEVIEADEVVITAPLGVLKANTIDFDPPLPTWKQGAIERLGFGLLNKVVLLYETPFWDDDRDMFGLLNEAERENSLDTEDYERKRGRFYLIWNASKTVGRPMLIALMAGIAAHEAEQTDTDTLLSEITGRLRGVFGSTKVPSPLEVIVTRWKRDPFTRGTYSYVAPETQPGDYDIMAESVGNLHFAGEATCGTHPATVHGAFLSGLRVASDVMESLMGEITLPDPLVGPSPLHGDVSGGSAMHVPHVNSPSGRRVVSANDPTVESEEMAIKQEESTINLASVPPARSAKAATKAAIKPAGPPRKSVCASDSSFWVSQESDSADTGYEAAANAAVISQLGERPVKPTRPGVNPFLLFAKDNWEEGKAVCGNEHSSNGRIVIRQTLGKWWRAASEETKQPFLEQSQAAQVTAEAARRDWETQVAQWDESAARIRKEYRRDHPPTTISESVAEPNKVGVSKRKTNVSNCIVLDRS